MLTRRPPSVDSGLSAWNQRESSQSKIDELQRSLAAPLSDLAVLEQHVAARKRQLEDWAGEFSIERYELSVVDNDGATSTSVVHPSFLGDDGAELSLQLTPRFEYRATVEHSGNARHYRIGSDNPNLAVGHRGIRFNGRWVQDWLVKASEGEVVRLGVSTTGDNEGAPQATEIELSMFDAETGSTLLGPTSTALTLGSLHIFSYHNTSTARDIRVNLVPDGDFRLKKVGGDDGVYVMSCPAQEGVTFVEGMSCPIGIFEPDNRHNWFVAWNDSTTPELGETTLRIVDANPTLQEVDVTSEIDRLLGRVSDVAAQTGRVTIASISVEGTGTHTDEFLEYRTQFVAMVVTGQTHNQILEFLKNLHEEMPFVDITDTRLSGFGRIPTASVDFRFLLSPQTPSEEGT